MNGVTREKSSYTKVLVAVDFSEHSETALQKALQLTDEGSAVVELIHVVEIPVYPVLEDVAVMGMPGLWDEEAAQQLTNAAQKKLQALATKFSIGSFKVVPGMADVDITEYAKSHGFDLIVMGSHGVSGWKRLIGSTTNAVINSSECDVLAVKI